MLKLFKVLLSGCLAIALLSIFCFGYSYNMIHLEEESGATDCISVPGSYVAEMEEGIAWNKIDAYGNNNKRTYDVVDVLMMGGSNIEAIHLSKKDNVTYLLDENLEDYNVYSIGQSGHDIYTCVQNLEAACKKYTPKYVVMDIGVEKLDIESMKMVLEGEYPNGKIEKRMTIKILRNCLPAIANMVLHLKEWIALAPENETGEVDDAILDDEYDDILEQFLEYANETVSRHGAKLILLHYPLRYSFDENGKMSVLYDKESFGLLKNRCEQNGILIADCAEKFEKMYAEDHVLPNGFVNTVWGAGHLNKYGHEACARALAETIRSLEEEE